MHIGQSRDFRGNFGELSSDDTYFLWNSEVIFCESWEK